MSEERRTIQLCEKFLLQNITKWWVLKVFLFARSTNRVDLNHGIEHAKTVQVATIDQGSLAKQSKVRAGLQSLRAAYQDEKARSFVAFLDG